MQRKIELQMLCDDMLDCRACEFREKANQPMIPIYEKGGDYVDLMVIVSRPSHEENTLNWSFGSRENKYVKSLIEPIFPLDGVYFTYMSKCWSRETALLGVSNTKTCREKFLEKEIELIKPKLILTMGVACGKILLKHFEKIPILHYLYVNKYSNGDLFGSAMSESPVALYNQGTKKNEDFIDLLTRMNQLITF